MEPRRRTKRYGKKTSNTPSFFVNSDFAAFDEWRAADQLSQKRSAKPLSEVNANSHQLTNLSPTTPAPQDTSPAKSASAPPNGEVQVADANHGEQLVDYLRPIEHSGVTISEWTTWQAIATKVKRESLQVKKIKEGSYCEVYSIFGGELTRVFKAIPILPPEGTPEFGELRRDEMTSVQSVAAELATLERLQAIPGFVETISTKVIQGSPCGPWADARLKWWAGINGRRKSQYPNPRNKNGFDDNQIWVVIEMEHAGHSMRYITRKDPLAYWDIFWRVCKSLAQAEDLIEFEHRDLHDSNICVREGADRLSAIKSVAEIDQLPLTGPIALGYGGFTPTIIDCTLSRSKAPRTKPSQQDHDKENTSVQWLDLETMPYLFSGGRSHQYDIYIWMRSCVIFQDRTALVRNTAKQSCRGHHSNHGAGAGTWADYKPLTNVLWLYALLEKTLKKLDCPSPTHTSVDGRESAILQAQMKHRVELGKRARTAMLELYSQLHDEIENDQSEKVPWIASAKDIIAWGVASQHLSKGEIWGDE